MIKYIAILATFFCLSQSQRPPYAGSSNRYPAVLPQYLEARREEVAASGVASRIDGNGDDVDTVIGNRIDNDPSRTTTPFPYDLPVDARGDVELVRRISTWPREKQPFWYLNWKQIQEHRGDANNRAQPVITQPNTRSFFAG